MTAQRKLQPQISEFDLAISDWLTGDMSGHLGPYMYVNDTNDGRWKNGHSSERYYLGRDDKTTFDIMMSDLNLLTETVIDLGPGGGASVTAKSLPIVEATLAAKYIPVDLSPTLAYAAAEQVSQQLNISASPLVVDFFNLLPVKEPNALVALMGGTLGNLEAHATPQSLQARLEKIFVSYRRSVTHTGFFLVSFDANTNVQEIIDCYQNPEMGELTRSCVDRAIDTSDFDYDVTWTPETRQVALGLRSQRDQMVPFNGERFAVEQGEFLPVLNSYRFPVPFVITAAEKAGWKHWKTWSATGRVHYLLFAAQ